MKKGKRIIKYRSFDDDFAGTDISTKKVTGDFPYVRKCLLWRLCGWFTYHIIARPTVYLICRFGHGLTVRNRRELKKLKSTGFFLYGNHAQSFDAFIPHIVAYPHKAYIISNPDAVSLPGLRNLVQMLGCLPVPDTLPGLIALNRAVGLRCSQKGCIVVYPEAHIWPYYTGIRPFSADSFTYPVRL